MDYAEIKILAKERKLRVTDLIVLAPANDPFYVGTDGDILLAKWFYELWQRFSYNSGVHIRRVHYQIVSQKARVLMPNGMLLAPNLSKKCLTLKISRYPSPKTPMK